MHGTPEPVVNCLRIGLAPSVISVRFGLSPTTWSRRELNWPPLSQSVGVEPLTARLPKSWTPSRWANWAVHETLLPAAVGLPKLDEQRSSCGPLAQTGSLTVLHWVSCEEPQWESPVPQ